MTCKARRRCGGLRAFSLVELLIVITVIGVLMALLIPAVQEALKVAHAVQCKSNIRQLTMAFLKYAKDHDGELPGNCWDGPGVDGDWLGGFITTEGLDGPWRDAPQNGTLWPYMGGPVTVDETTGEQEGVEDVGVMGVYVCPADAKGNGRFSYSAVLALTGVPVSTLYRGAILTVLDEHDEEKEVHTAMPLVVEEDPLCNIGGNYREGGFATGDRLTTRHWGGAHVGFVDGHVEQIRVPAWWCAGDLILITPSGERRLLPYGTYEYGDLLGEM